MTIIKNTKSESVKLDDKTIVVKNIFETASVTLTKAEAINLVNAINKEFKIHDELICSQLKSGEMWVNKQ